MPRTSLLLAALLTALLPSAIHGQQLLDDEPLSRGAVGLSLLTSFTSWDERFGTDGERIPLGAALRAEDALALHPGGDLLTGALRALGAAPDYTPALGPIEGRVAHDATRLDLGLRFAPFDWLTLAVVVPRVKTRTSVDLVFVPDTLAADLGVNPALQDPAAVEGFLTEMSRAALEAAELAQSLCGAADPGCADAEALALRAGELEGAARAAYGATPFFPYRGTGAAAAMEAALSGLDADLRAAGIQGLDTAAPLATIPASEQGLAEVARSGAYGYQGALADRTDLWRWGDVELSATARLLSVGAAPSAEGRGLTLFGGVLVRLGTGHAPDPDLPLALGSGDGQTDVEGRVGLRAALSDRLGVRAGVRHGRQGAREIVRRVAPPGVPLAPAESRTELRWQPGAYTALDLEPTFRLTPELGLAGVYRGWRRARDAYEALEATPAGLDPALLEPSAVTTHVAGIALVYDSTRRWAAGAGILPVRVQGRLLRALGGRGGAVPAPVRAELGLQLLLGVPGLR